MEWLEKLSPSLYLPITTCFGRIQKRAKRGCRSLMERTRSRPALTQLPLQEPSYQRFHLSLHRYSDWFVSTSSTLETFVLRCYRVPFPANRSWISCLTKYFIIYAKLNLVNVRSAFIDSKINRLPPQGFEHDFN